MGGKAVAALSQATGGGDESRSYRVKVTADALNVRKGSGTGYAKTGCIRDKSTYTIVEATDG